MFKILCFNWVEATLSYSKIHSHNWVCTAARVHHWSAQAKEGIKPMAGKTQAQQSQCLIQLANCPFYATQMHCVQFVLVFLGRSFCSRKPWFLKVLREKNASGMIAFFFSKEILFRPAT
jgi:hypothetical protein